MSILTFCMVGFMVVLGFVIILMGILGRSLFEAAGGNFSLLGAIATGFFYSLISLVYVAPAIYLHRYAGAIGRLQAGPSGIALIVLRLRRTDNHHWIRPCPGGANNENRQQP